MGWVPVRKPAYGDYFLDSTVKIFPFSVQAEHGREIKYPFQDFPRHMEEPAACHDPLHGRGCQQLVGESLDV